MEILETASPLLLKKEPQLHEEMESKCLIELEV